MVYYSNHEYDRRINYNRYGTLNTRRSRNINWADVDIKSDEYYNNSDGGLKSIERDYCGNARCGRKLVYSDKIQKRFCPECFSNLTRVERDILLTPTNNISAAEDTVGVSDDIETGIIHPNEEGFVPMKRGGNTDVITRQLEDEAGGSFARQPTRMERIRDKRYAQQFPGLDDELRGIVRKAGGHIVKTSEDLPPPGDTPTLSGDDLKKKREWIFRTRDTTYRIS